MNNYGLLDHQKAGVYKTSAGLKYSNCIFKQLCFPKAMLTENSITLDQLIKTRIDISQGQTLFKKGVQSDLLYIVRAGSLKTELPKPGKKSQVMGFHLPGDWVGIDGIHNGAHYLDAIALEPSRICSYP